MANVHGTELYLVLLLRLADLVCGQIEYSIPEELDIGAFVGNIAEDLGLNIRKLLVRRLQLLPRDMSHYFAVNTQTGILSVSERIDRELFCMEASTCSISLDLAVENPDVIFPIEVEILDINDNSPTFPNDVISLQLSELLAPGARFPLESAHDPDVGLNSVANYHLSLNEFFSLKVQTRKDGSKIAEIILEKPVDRERNPSFDLVLTAVDGGIPHWSGTTRVLITITDINDNAPAFDRDIYSVDVLENVPLGTLLIKVHAIDLDEGSNAEFKYSFSHFASQKVRALFNLDAETGEIKVAGQLDFERVCDYELDVQAVDTLPNVGHAKVLVSVVDVNDNAPDIKLTSVRKVVPEDAVTDTVIAVFAVMDRDSGENGLVRCQILVNIPFKMEPTLPNHYKIMTSKQLDRETISEYNISISACDAGSPSLTTIETITVSVSDINDNVPRFSKSSYDIYLMENNVPGGYISSVTAVDPDLDDNGNVAYSILDNKLENVREASYFAINSKRGSIIALRSFDYEQMKSFQMTILARDAGSPSLSSTAIVRVIILDQNDNIPFIISPATWNGSVAFAVVPRSIYPNYLVTKIIANDEDSGQNARLSYEITEATDLSLFTVGLHNGEIRTTRTFTEDDGPTLKIVVLVKDNGQPSLSNIVTISLSITSNSTESPSERTIQQKNVEYFPELNTYLILILGSTSLLFLLIIILLVVFKCKQDRSNAIYQSSTTYCCCMRRNSDVAFQRRPVPNESLNYYGAGQMQANSDPYQYMVRLSPESSKSDFLFLSTCHPTLPLTDISTDDVAIKCKRCKREMSLYQGSRCIFQKNHISAGMLQAACRRTLKRFMTPSIFLLCAWILVSGQLRYSISEEEKHGTIVGKIAEDLGLAVEELLRRRFRIVSDSPTQYLDIDLTTGILFVTKTIDREELCPESLICMLPLEALIELPVEQYRAEIEILDINDNSPRFPVSEIRLEITEFAIPGARFPLPDAHDPDVGVNSIRTYQLSANDHFVLDVQIRGEAKIPELILTNTIDRERQSLHRLLLTALDGGSPQRTGTTNVIIIALDANDNAPVFQQTLYVVGLMENVPSGTLVIKLNASDLDAGSNKDISYSFSGYNKARVSELFAINPISGEITVKGILDFEETKNYDLDVEAKDKGLHPLSTHCRIQVNLNDVNDNAPDFALSTVPNIVREDTSTGTLLALINVRDRDSHANGHVDCNITPNHPFALKSSFKNSYRLVTDDILDRELASEHKISIICKDRGSPPLSTTKTFIIHISDINDNAPIFQLSLYTVHVMENHPPGNSIGRVSATDGDINLNSFLSYTILESEVQDAPLSSYVSINPETGVIYSQRAFDYEHLKNFQFRIQAQDSGIPPLSTNVTVNVVILDQNDNPPVIKIPESSNYSMTAIARSESPGYLAIKIIVSDADSGQNARLFYHIIGATDPGLFTISRNSGEVRTARYFKDTDAIIQKIIIHVRDNGHPTLSATTTVTLSVGEQIAEIRSEFGETSAHLQNSYNLPFVIVIFLGLLSFILLVVIIALSVAIWPMNRRPTYGRRRSCAACCDVGDLESERQIRNAQLKLQFASDPKIDANVLEVRRGSSLDTYHCRVRSTTQGDATAFSTPFCVTTAESNERNPGIRVDKLYAQETSDQTDKRRKVSSIFK
ncbi:uncharacterized protein LOC144599766 [Rhinoraja longicauda]